MVRSKGKTKTGRKISGLVLGLLAGGLIIYQALVWPNVAALEKKNPKTTAFMELYKERQKQSGKKPWVAWKWVAYSKISPNLKIAVLVSEDINFFHHNGFDADEMKNAISDAMEQGELPRGASTISQQVSKNLWLSPSRNPLRKLKEALLTMELEHFISKKRILEIYLNIAEFGPGIYGAEAASRAYYKKSASELTEDQAASLSASLPLPRYWHPGSQSKYYAKRIGIVLDRMSKAQFLKKLI